MTNPVAASLQFVARCTPYTRCNVQQRACFTYKHPCKKAAIGPLFLQALIAGKINFVASRCSICCSPGFPNMSEIGATVPSTGEFHPMAPSARTIFMGESLLYKGRFQNEPSPALFC